jgi:DNA repair photolyase
VQISEVTITNILTRSSGFLTTVSSHSLQPYRGCALGSSLCGVGCYVRHNGHVTQGREWGSFVEIRTNAAESYRTNYAAERRWAVLHRGRFGIFLSSATEPFQPVERKAGITRQVLEAMVELPPDFLILQSHSHHVADYVELYRRLADIFELRIHVSIESDRDTLPGLPPPGSSVEKRLAAAAALRAAGLRTVVTVSPLLPIAEPDTFFQRLAQVADAVVIDHYIEGDGSPTGARTLRTRLPLAMQAVDPLSVTLEYREQMVAVAGKYFPGRVGVNIDGFAGRMGPAVTNPKPESPKSETNPNAQSHQGAHRA